MTLRPVNKVGNRFCGPAVISAVTGVTTDEAARLIRLHCNKRVVMGTHIWHLKRVFGVLGYEVEQLPTPMKPYPTIARWLKLNKEIRTVGRVFLLSAGHHWQLVSGRRFVCGRTVEIVSVRDKRVPRRARVKGVWEIVKTKTKGEHHGNVAHSI